MNPADDETPEPWRMSATLSCSVQSKRPAMSCACDAKKRALSQTWWWRFDRTEGRREQGSLSASAMATWRKIGRGAQGSHKKGCCASPSDVDASADRRIAEGGTRRPAPRPVLSRRRGFVGIRKAFTDCKTQGSQPPPDNACPYNGAAPHAAK
jgi:hypothetical protein